jgi:hypothetical protein
LKSVNLYYYNFAAPRLPKRSGGQVCVKLSDSLRLNFFFTAKYRKECANLSADRQGTAEVFSLSCLGKKADFHKILITK